MANHPTLLIAEDDPHLRYLLVSAAERTGAFSRVLEAPDGEAALAAVRNHLRGEAVPPSILLVLSDLDMPRLDGLDLLRSLKSEEETREIPVAIMTSSNRANDRSDATAAGCCAFFYKPQRLDQFAMLLAALPRICGAAAEIPAQAS
jgi:CheY-like chemotaxis protein